MAIVKNPFQALILQQFIFWSPRTKNFQKMRMEEKKRGGIA
jgi:hypothetical protein